MNTDQSSVSFLSRSVLGNEGNHTDWERWHSVLSCTASWGEPQIRLDRAPSPALLVISERSEGSFTSLFHQRLQYFQTWPRSWWPAPALAAFSFLHLRDPEWELAHQGTVLSKLWKSGLAHLRTLSTAGGGKSRCLGPQAVCGPVAAVCLVRNLSDLWMKGSNCPRC